MRGGLDRDPSSTLVFGNIHSAAFYAEMMACATTKRSTNSCARSSCQPWLSRDLSQLSLNISLYTGLEMRASPSVAWKTRRTKQIQIKRHDTSRASSAVVLLKDPHGAFDGVVDLRGNLCNEGVEWKISARQ